MCTLNQYNLYNITKTLYVIRGQHDIMLVENEVLIPEKPLINTKDNIDFAFPNQQYQK